MGMVVSSLTDTFNSATVNEEKAMKWAKSQEKKGALNCSLEEVVERKVAAMNILNYNATPTAERWAILKKMRSKYKVGSSKQDPNN
jgi:hypothetical protein